MPFVLINTNVSQEKIPQNFMADVSKEVGNALGKPEQYMCIQLNAGQNMIFGCTDAPCAWVEVNSAGGNIGGEHNKTLTKVITKLLHDNLGIPTDRFYIKMNDLPRGEVGYRGNTLS